MKTNLHNLLKTSIAVCLLIVCSTSANAQIGKKLTREKKADFMEGKVKPMITSPAAGSTVNGPFVMVGKAEPGTYINLYVNPIYKLSASTNGKPILVVSTPQHKIQHFSVKADDKGVWQSPVIEVMFDSKTTDRRIFAFVSQTWGKETYETKNIEYLASPKLVMVTVPAKLK